MMLCHYAECGILFIIMLSVDMLSVDLLSVVILGVVILGVVMLSVMATSTVDLLIMVACLVRKVYNIFHLKRK
jgi:hypothetical protein